VGRDPYTAWAVVAALAAVLSSVLSLATLHRLDLTHAVSVGWNFHRRDGVAELLYGSRPSPWSPNGFDGQFFLALGHDPWLRRPALVRALDAPRFRARRILYPLVARAIENRHTSVPFGMVMAQYLSLFAISLFAAVMLRRAGANPLWVFCVPLAPGLAHAVETLTCETLTTALILAAVVAIEWSYLRYAWLALALALLAKEDAVLFVAALCATAAVDRDAKRFAYWASTVLPYLMWAVYVSLRLPPSEPGAGSLQNIGWPLAGWLTTTWHSCGLVAAGDDVAISLLVLLCRCWMLVAAVVAVLVWWQSPSPASRFAAATAAVALCLAGGPAVPAYDLTRNFARQLHLVPTALFLAAVASNDRRAWRALALLPPLALATHVAFALGRVSF